MPSHPTINLRLMYQTGWTTNAVLKCGRDTVPFERVSRCVCFDSRCSPTADDEPRPRWPAAWTTCFAFGFDLFASWPVYGCWPLPGDADIRPTKMPHDASCFDPLHTGRKRRVPCRYLIARLSSGLRQLKRYYKHIAGRCV